MSPEEQIMPKDKYQGSFLKSNGDYCDYYPCYPFQILFSQHAGPENKGTLPRFPQL